MNNDVVLCIPTLLKYDLCNALIISANKGSIKPTKYHIIDNGGGYAEYLKKHPLPMSIDLHTPDKNMGVAASWNYFIKNNSGRIIISNDDIELSSNSLQLLLDEYNTLHNDTSILFSVGGLNAFSFFLIDTNIINNIGYFDDNFYPAYFEDNDYIYRMQLAGCKQHIVRKLPIKHYGSATLEEQKKRGQLSQHHINFRKNRDYFVSKWGGLPGHEKFSKPFNK